MTASAQLEARGKPITLTDGRAVFVRYGFRALAYIEQHFGSIQAMQQALGGTDGPVMTSLVRALAAGLLHEHDGAGAPLTPDRLYDLLDTHRTQDYMAVIGEAFTEAFPTTAPAEDVATPGQQPPFLGPTGTTSPPSPSDGPTSSSGT